MLDVVNVAWENIMVGLIAVAIVELAAYGKRFYKNKKIESKYPIAGEYLSVWEDDVGGERVLKKGPAILKQSGDSVTGSVYAEGDERQWDINGNITEHGYINGMYIAENPYDRSLGTFFLDVDRARTMEGLWSGYDPVNSKVNSGRWVFQPSLADTCTIRTCTARDVAPIIDIGNRTLGEGYVRADQFRRSLSPSYDDFTLVAEVKATGRVVGFQLCASYTREELMKYLKVGGEKLPLGITNADRIGVLKIAGVIPEMQGRGIGSALIGEAVRRLSAQNVDASLAVAWKYEDKINIGRILTRFGYQPSVEVKNYWSEESQQEEWKCARCGGPPCECTGVIYTRFF